MTQKKKLGSFIVAVILVSMVGLVLLAAFKTPEKAYAAPQNFKDYSHLKKYVEERTKIARLASGLLYVAKGDFDVRSDFAGAAEETSPASRPEHSTTNVQVAGVDEADIVKNDGRYLYILSRHKLVIVRAYPPENAAVLSSTELAGSPKGIFVRDSKLAVFVQKTDKPGLSVSVYDVEDRSRPELIKEFALTGASYVTSRMIDNHVYLIANVPTDLNLPAEYYGRELKLPEIVQGDGSTVTVPAGRIKYFDDAFCPEYRYSMIVAVNLDTLSRNIETFLTGAAQEVYMSENNIYLVSPGDGNIAPVIEKHLDAFAGAVPGEAGRKLRAIVCSGLSLSEKIDRMEALNSEINGVDVSEDRLQSAMAGMKKEIMRAVDKTTVRKFAAAGQNIEYLADTEVPGRVLNQFSMDEYKGNFRIATTTCGSLWQRWNTENNVFVYDEKLKEIGRLTGLAPGERIYSARFMGDRAYLVTFRETDPFFVINLARPENPKTLGYLKIPGYSGYLHPYDENHIIGIGKETEMRARRWEESVAPGRPGTVLPPPPRVNAVKIALFDATNPEKPVEMSKYVIDKSSSDSAALRDHKAFLFSRPKNLLAVPVSYPVSAYMDFEKKVPVYSGLWQGAYVFDVSLEKGITLKGTVDHSKAVEAKCDSGEAVKRILYIGDLLYTISDKFVKINSLNDMQEIKTVKL